MSGPNDPKVHIPHHDSPAGTRISVRTVEGRLTYEKAEDGDWAVVACEAAPREGAA